MNDVFERKQLTYRQRWFLAYGEDFYTWSDRNMEKGDIVLPFCGLEDTWDANGIPKFEDEIIYESIVVKKKEKFIPPWKVQ